MSLLAGRYVHGGTHVTDSADSLFDQLYLGLFLFEAPLLLKLRPCGNHDGFLSGQIPVNLLGNEGHIGMQKLQGVGQYGLQRPQGCRLGLILFIIETGLHHLDIPVAELLPDEVIKLLNGDTQLKFIHIGRHVLCQGVDLGQNPLVCAGELCEIHFFYASSRPAVRR